MKPGYAQCILKNYLNEVIENYQHVVYTAVAATSIL